MQTSPRAPHTLDFRTLEVFRLVYRLRSFSAAAEALDSSQSNVSYVIGKLRDALGDPLFLKTARGVEPTEKAHAVFEFADATLEALGDLVHSGPFDPASTTQTIVLSCNHYQRELLMPGLFRALQSRAPGLHLHVLTASDLGQAQLKQGQADLLICPQMPDDESLHSEKLLEEHYACVAAGNGVWAARQTLDLNEYLAAPHVTVRYGAGWKSGYQRQLDALGVTLNECHVVPSPSDLHALLPDTNRISTLPFRQARRMQPAYHVLPCPAPAPFEMRLYWATRTHKSPVHGWLRALIREIAATIE